MRLRLGAACPVLLGALVLSGCSLVGGGVAPVCRPLEVAEFPLLGGIRGAWMDEERFVLADLHQDRLMVYSTSKGLVRIVNGWEGADLELNFASPMDIERWGDGFVLAETSLRGPFRLLGLDANLRPGGVLWQSDVERVDGRWKGKEVANIFRLLALGDRLYLEAGRFEDSENP